MSQAFVTRVHALNDAIEEHVRNQRVSTGPEPDDGASDPPQAYYELGDLLRSAAPEIARVLQVAEGLLDFGSYVPWTEWYDLRVALGHLNEKAAE